MSLNPLFIATDGILGTPLHIAFLGLYSITDSGEIPDVIEKEARRINLRFGRSGAARRDPRYGPDETRKYTIHFMLVVDAPYIPPQKSIKGVKEYTCEILGDRIAVTFELEEIKTSLPEEGEIVIEASVPRRIT